MSAHINSNGNINRTLYNPAVVAHMIMDGAYENNRIDRFQWSFVPFFHDGKDRICDPADGAVRDLDIIQFPHMTLDIACHYFLRIYGDNLFFYILSNSILLLLDDLWFKFIFSIPGDIDYHISITDMW